MESPAEVCCCCCCRSVSLYFSFSNCITLGGWGRGRVEVESPRPIRALWQRQHKTHPPGFLLCIGHRGTVQGGRKSVVESQRCYRPGDRRRSNPRRNPSTFTMRFMRTRHNQLFSPESSPAPKSERAFGSPIPQPTEAISRAAGESGGTSGAVPAETSSAPPVSIFEDALDGAEPAGATRASAPETADGTSEAQRAAEKAIGDATRIDDGSLLVVPSYYKAAGHGSLTNWRQTVRHFPICAHPARSRSNRAPAHHRCQ